MHFRFKGHGIWGIFIVLGVLIILRSLIECIPSSPAAILDKHLTGTVFAISGMLTFWIAASADKKNGIDAFSKDAWTSDFMTSAHISFNMPMRHVGILLIGLSLFF